jgi:two-component system response regulator MprA
MPGLDGLAVTRRLRAKGLRVPILLLTARDAVHERVAGLDAGADDYLVKPFDADELTARVRALLRRNAPPGETLAFADVTLESGIGVSPIRLSISCMGRVVRTILERSLIACGCVAACHSRGMAALLLVDDDPPIRRMLERTLSAEGYDVRAAADGGAALAAVERSVPDAIVLDVTMPGLDGLAVTRRLRAKGLRVPILLLTARDAVHERVAGLDAGADDYLVKPFDADELSARVRALLRRNAPAAGETLAFADVVLEPESGVARRAGRELELTRREAELLELLLRNARGVVTRELALEEVWGGEGEATPNAVDRYVAYLRRKLGDPPLIHTVRGIGFRLDRE